MFALGGILKLCGDLFALIGPLAIQQIVQYIEGLYAQARAQVEEAGGMGLGSNPNAATDAADVDVNGIADAADADNPVYYDNDDVDVDNGGGPFGLAIGIGQHSVRIYYASWSDLLTNGWSIAWLVLLAALAQAALSQASTHVLNMTGIRIKTSLQGLIYRKSLLLNAGSAGFGGGADDAGADDAGAADASGGSGDGGASGNPTARVVQQNGDIKLTPNAQQQTERSGGECLALYNTHFVAVSLSLLLSHSSFTCSFLTLLPLYPNRLPSSAGKCAFGVN